MKSFLEYKKNKLNQEIVDLEVSKVIDEHLNILRLELLENISARI